MEAAVAVFGNLLFGLLGVIVVIGIPLAVGNMVEFAVRGDNADGDNIIKAWLWGIFGIAGFVGLIFGLHEFGAWISGLP